jgi:glycosyltransferase involved in cell wall biosynthesis
MLAQIRNIFFKKPAQGKGFSVLCVYNNRQKFNDYLVTSLNRQTIPFELIAIDNTTGKFNSAAPLLNEAAKNAKYDYLMFAHQDVSLDSPKWLERVRKDLEKLYPFGAAGVAGKLDKEMLASVSHGNPPCFVGKIKLRKPARVQTLDGCLMIVPKETFLKMPFDEAAVDGWMLYVANYCLDLIRQGYRNYVLPHEVYHESTGCEDRDALQNVMTKIIARHQDHVKTIYTTVGTWKTS